MSVVKSMATSASIIFVLVAAECVGLPRAAVADTCGIEVGKGQPPLEVDLTQGPGTCGFLQFTWRAFLALNWPPKAVAPEKADEIARGIPDETKLIGKGGDNETVWEQYQPNWYLFAPNNPPPKAAGNGESFVAWNRDAGLPAACGTTPQPGMKILSSLSKFDGMPGVIQAFSPPLIDQRGYYARYEIRLSYETFNFVNANTYYLDESQRAQHGAPFVFPVQQGTRPGAILVKAAWKTLSQDEINSGRFHTAKAFLFTPDAPGLQPTCVGPTTVGLVGLHIVQKTAGFPKMIWATFEQIDNVPDDPANPGDRKWSFFTKSPPPGKTPNVGPKCPSSSSPCDWQPTSSHLGDQTGGPTQVVRLNPLEQSVNQPALDQINVAAQAEIVKVDPKSVWQFYRLVDAQWQQGTAFFPATHVVNVTMETYKQKGLNPSCMECHKNAKSVDGAEADLTFQLLLGWKPTVSNPLGDVHD